MGLQDVEILFPILPFLPRDDVNSFLHFSLLLTHWVMVFLFSKLVSRSGSTYFSPYGESSYGEISSCTLSCAAGILFISYVWLLS